MSKLLEARERAKDLAIEGCSVAAIRKKLEDEGLGELVDQFELEAIVTKSDYVRSMLPERPKKTLPRVIGFIAVITGVAAMYIGAGGSSGGRSSPRGLGLLSIIIGIVLIVKPSIGKEDP